MKNKNKNLIKIGNNIKKIRKKQNLSQEELAFKSGLHRTYIGSVERGEKNITILNLIKIANSLNTELSIFFNLLDEEEDDTNE